MRLITKKIHLAFFAGRALTLGNTRTDGNSVWLHGNKIVEMREDGVYATLAGWNTPTTRERVNGITGARFSQKNFTPHLDGKPIDANEWHKVLG